MIFNRSQPPSGYYVYLYLREDGTPYYCGKGTGVRAWTQHRNIKERKGVWTPADHNRIVMTAIELTEDEAHQEERRLVALYGRKDIGTGILHNRTNGGCGGISGRLESAELREYRSKTRTGVPRPDMIGNKLAAGHRSKTTEHQDNINKALNTKVVKDKMKTAWKNKPIVTCPHCGLSGKGPNMTRYHNDNCKRKTQ